MTDKNIETNKKAALEAFKKELKKYKKKLEAIENEKQKMLTELKKIKDDIFDYNIHDSEVSDLDYECQCLIDDINGRDPF